MTCLSDLVDFVDEDNTSLSRFDIEVCRMQQLQQKILNIFTNVTGFRQRRGVADRVIDNSGPLESLDAQLDDCWAWMRSVASSAT